MTKFTTNDILEAISAAVTVSADPDGAATKNEIVAASGLSEGMVTQRLMGLKREGRLEVVRVKREAIDGNMRSAPAYRVLPVARKKAS